MSANPASNPLTDINGVLFDGDNDDTPGGDFYGLFALGNKVAFRDSSGTRVSLAVQGGGAVNVWRELDGDIDQLSVVGAVAASSSLAGYVRRGAKSDCLHRLGDDSRRIATDTERCGRRSAAVIRHTHAGRFPPAAACRHGDLADSGRGHELELALHSVGHAGQHGRHAALRESRPRTMRRRRRQRRIRTDSGSFSAAEPTACTISPQRRDQLPARFQNEDIYRNQSGELANLVGALEPRPTCLCRPTTR